MKILNILEKIIYFWQKHPSKKRASGRKRKKGRTKETAANAKGFRCAAPVSCPFSYNRAPRRLIEYSSSMIPHSEKKVYEALVIRNELAPLNHRLDLIETRPGNALHLFLLKSQLGEIKISFYYVIIVEALSEMNA